MRLTKPTSLVTWLTLSALLVSMCAGTALSRKTSAQTINETNGQDVAEARQEPGTLSRYAIDLTTLAREQNLETVQGYDAEISRVIDSLSGGSSKAPLIIGQSDFDRGAIARGVAFKVASGNVPEELLGKSVYSLNLDALAKSAKTSQEFEARLQAVFAEAESDSGRVILFSIRFTNMSERAPQPSPPRL